MSGPKQSYCLPCFWEGTKPDQIRAVIEAGARIGYPAFEIHQRDGLPFHFICELARENGMTIASMCGHQSLTDGLNKREDHARIAEELRASIDLAAEHRIPNLICFSGNREGKGDAESVGVCAEGLAPVIERAEAAGVRLNIELLNSRVNHPDYQCDHTAWGVAVCDAVGSPAVGLLYDIYHMQIMEGDLIRTITGHIAHIGHFHTAGNPGRHDMDDEQEIYYPAVARAIAATGYDRYVGHEFAPKGDRVPALEAAFRLFEDAV
jgi:hydroxypyruvate isomerase